MGTLSGYQIPPYNNLLVMPTPPLALVFQVIYVFIGLVLFMNLIIAILGSTYNYMQENATEEYRWTITRYLTQLKYSQWPSPLNLIQLIASGLYLLYLYFAVGNIELAFEGESFTSGLRINHFRLYSGIVQSYFEAALGDSYDRYVLPEKFDESYKEDMDVELDDMGDSGKKNSPKPKLQRPRNF